MKNFFKSKERIELLQEYLSKKRVGGFLQFNKNPFQSDYLPFYDEYISWLTGFTGTGGVFVSSQREATLFVDGRYVLQAKKETLIEVVLFSFENLVDWLSKNVGQTKNILYDPWLLTTYELRVLQKQNLKFKDVLENPIDSFWKNRIDYPKNPITKYDDKWVGKKSSDKQKEIIEILKDQKAEAFIITIPESIAWLLNIRGDDFRYLPVPRAFCILYVSGEIFVYTDSPINENIQNTNFLSFKQFENDLKKLANKNVFIDPSNTPHKIHYILENLNCNLIEGCDPCLSLRSIKTKREQKGLCDSHKRDSLAIINFLAWIDKKINKENVSVTEQEADNYLLKQRENSDFFKGPSFPTISAIGANGAIIHYECQYNNDLKKGGIYIIDSGGHYLDGTTDVTRTTFLGIKEPTKEHKEIYTRILKGHIALATGTFPAGTTGGQLDVLARLPLWQIGKDYPHSTGHGVGYYLNIHEGPHRIGKGGNEPLREGMIVTNEPGFYKEGEYGMRIENCMLVTKGTFPLTLFFEMLTFVPLELKLIDKNLLTLPEINWVNNYHKKIWNMFSSSVKGFVLKWLKEATLHVS
ncbi:MAG: aminopeptidase P family protein, partial [Alphaproteobacteria bacterium]